MQPVVERAGQWTGWKVDAGRYRQLRRLHQWLVAEAAPAGGIGPAEVDRVWERHLADSLLFAGGWREPSPPSRVVDLGSGVGLPGIPLAILWPQTQVVLVDRSGRRVDLIRRVVRILELGNADVLATDIAHPALTAELVVARAAGDPATVLNWAREWTAPGGKIVVGGSHRARPTPVAGEQIVEVPPEVLDRPVWLRMMAPP